MQLKKIAVFVAVVCAGIAGQVNAATLQDNTAQAIADRAVIDSAVLGGRVFFISGASATQKGFGEIIKTLFSSSIRLANTSASSKDFEAVAGTMKTGPWAGQTAIIIDRVLGGSVMGVNPVARGEFIQSLSVNTTDCTSGSGTSADPYVCLTTNNGTRPDMKPDAGISDVAPNKFQSPYNTEGEIAAAALDDTEIATFADATFNKPIYTLAFGIPVTNNINPKLTRATVAGIMAGTLSKWNEVDSTVAAEDIVVCRRVQGSGTQAVDNLYFGNYPCSANLVSYPTDRDSTTAWNNSANTYTITANSGYQVIENSTSGDVRNCLKAAGEATTAGGNKSYTTKDRNGATVNVTFQAKAGGHKAIGVLSMDSIGSSSDSVTAGKWSFRSLDGKGTVSCVGTAPTVAVPEGTGCPYVEAPTFSGTGRFPSEANLMDGTWDMQGWISWNVPQRTVDDSIKGAVAQEFITAAQNPAVIDSIADLKHVALALPAPFSAFSGLGVSQVQYAGGDQCGPLSK